MEELIKADICKHGNIHQWCDNMGECGSQNSDKFVKEMNVLYGRLLDVYEDCYSKKQLVNEQ